MEARVKYLTVLIIRSYLFAENEEPMSILDISFGLSPIKKREDSENIPVIDVYHGVTIPGESR